MEIYLPLTEQKINLDSHYIYKLNYKKLGRICRPDTRFISMGVEVLLLPKYI